MKLLEFETRNDEDTTMALVYEFECFLGKTCSENEETVALRAGAKACAYMKLMRGFKVLPIMEKKTNLIGHWYGLPIYRDTSIPADCALDVIDQDNIISHTIYLANMP